jgi:flavin-dependent dehydrogenase
MLRELAAATPGVDLLLGHKVTDLLRGADGVEGLLVRTREGRTRELRGRLTVGADGRSSTVAAKSGLRLRTSPHGRFGYSAHYTGVRLQTTASSQFWLDGRGMNFVFSNDAGRAVVGVMRPSEELPAFRADAEAELLASFERLPNRPDLSGATRVSDVIGMINYPSQRRALAGRGVTLVGDAGLVADYLWGVGCGWAFQSAEWLVDATAADLLRDQDLTRPLRRYARRMRRRLGTHHAMMSDYATGRPFNAVERLLWSSATVDDEVAVTLGAIGARMTSPLRILRPGMLGRMLLARRRAAAPVRIPPPRTAGPASATAANEEAVEPVATRGST